MLAHDSLLARGNRAQIGMLREQNNAYNCVHAAQRIFLTKRETLLQFISLGSISTISNVCFFTSFSMLGENLPDSLCGCEYNSLSS